MSDTETEVPNYCDWTNISAELLAQREWPVVPLPMLEKSVEKLEQIATKRSRQRSTSPLRWSGEDAVDPSMIVEPQRFTLNAEPPPALLECLPGLAIVVQQLGQLVRLGVSVDQAGQMLATHMPLFQLAAGTTERRGALLLELTFDRQEGLLD